MKLAYRHCRFHVQRLRGVDQAFTSLGSRGFVPGALRHLLPSCCSNPRRDWLCQTVRLCECTPWVVCAMKSGGALNHSEMPAKIAVFFLQKATARFLPAPKRADGVSGAKASSHCATTHYHFYRSNGLEAATGTHPPFFSQPP